MEQLWKSVLDEIELEVSRGTYLTFIKNTSLVSYADNVATISSSTSILAEYIEKRYYSLLKKILDKKTNANNSLVFVAKNPSKATDKPASLGPLFVEQPARRPRKTSGVLRKEYSFETFAVSESNQLGYTACLTVAQDPGDKYNPLFLYGSVGVGKTHLMHAVARVVVDKEPDTHIVYMTTEEFTNEVVEAIRDKTTPSLRKKFRNADLLLLDDVQFLSGKERVQEELFHTFNALVDRGKQIVFTSDKAPSEIKKLEARLASRFTSGLTVDIQPPDFELRTAILLKKSEKHKLGLSPQLAQLAAERISDTRALEGFLLRLLTEMSTNKIDLSEGLILRLLGDKAREDASSFRPDDVIGSICSYYGIKSTQIKGAKRDASLVLPRHICMYILKEEAGLSFVEVGNLLGGRDHTTVIHGVEKIKHLLSTSDRLREEIVFIKKSIKDRFLQ